MQMLKRNLKRDLQTMLIKCSKCGFHHEVQPAEVQGQLFHCEQCHLFFPWGANNGSQSSAAYSVVKRKDGMVMITAEDGSLDVSER